MSVAMPHWQHTVTSVEGPMQALEFVEEHDVDLIFAEYCMPCMTGYDFLREVKCMCLHGGAEDYIIKPLRIAHVPCILSHIQ
ncbi:two-component response regulator ORR13-like [Triticum dicoccoides]|uniref:two-component response regulator ORR13-like n=1 Tax=Triticum dicoccoides TaxID=85692 RepID=UPI00188E0839|nr:two-component response regulator ORR13-like [Triticum dicoccoides]